MAEATSSNPAQGLALLRDVYENRLGPALAHRAAGGEVVGAMGHGLPAEIALACGCLPVMLAPLPGRPTPFAEPYVNHTLDPQKRAVFDQLLSGEVEFMAVVMNIATALQESYTFHWARHLLAMGEAQSMPPLHQYILLGNRIEASYELGLEHARALERRLRTITGERATNERLAEAIKAVNAARAAIRDLNGHRRAGRVSGVDGLTASIAYRFMHPSAFTEALKAFNAEAANAPKRPGPRAIAVSASKLSNVDLHRVLEDGGLNVVGEDDTWGARAGTPDIATGGGDLLEEVFRHYHLYTPNRAVYPATVRYEWLYEEAGKPDVDVLVFYMPPSDRVLGWDYPRLYDRFSAAGKTVLKLRCDLETPAGREEALAATRRVVADLKERA